MPGKNIKVSDISMLQCSSQALLLQRNISTPVTDGPSGRRRIRRSAARADTCSDWNVCEGKVLKEATGKTEPDLQILQEMKVPAAKQKTLNWSLFTQ